MESRLSLTKFTAVGILFIGIRPSKIFVNEYINLLKVSVMFRTYS